LDFLDDIARKGLELHSFMLIRSGCVLAEGWWKPYAPELNHALFSLSKSFTATAIGMAVDSGLVTVDDRVVDFFPDKLPPDLDSRWRALTIKHLLTMTSGHSEDPFGKMITAPDGDWVKAYFACPLQYEPGTVFVYSTGATYMLAAIIQRVTGEKLIDYLRPRLFEPLGIANPTWWECPMGISVGGTGLSITTEDIAKFGLLFLNRGRWNGAQLVSEGWVQEASAKQVCNYKGNPNSDWEQGYGYQMWRCRHGAYRGDGAVGQYCVVMPEQDAVIAITSGIREMQPVLDSIWEHILPRFGGPLPENPALQEELKARLDGLSLPMLPGMWNEQAAARVAEVRYDLEPNAFGLTGLEFFPASGELRMTAWFGSSSVPLRAGFGDYIAQEIRGQADVLTRRLLGEGPYLMCATWDDDSTLTCLARFVETPFSRTAVIRFAGDELNLEISQNCSFGPTEYPPIRGRARRD